MKTQMTQSRLAATLGVSRQLIAFHRKSGKAPPLNDIEAWTEFLAVNGREGSMPRELRREAGLQRIRLVRGQADRIERENKVRNRELIEFDGVRRFLEFLTRDVFFAHIQKFREEFPVVLKAKSELEIFQELERQFGGLQKSITASLQSWLEQERPKGEAEP